MLKFTKNLAAIHGYLCSDGYVVRNKPSQKNKYYHIGLRNTCDVLLNDFEEKFQSAFDVKPRRCSDGRSVVQNKGLYFLLTKDFSYYSREWVIPNLSKHILNHWLRAFFDAEGWVMNRVARDRHIGLDSVNRKGIIQIKKALSSFGILSKLKYIKAREIYRLLIFGRSNLILFRERIGFLHPKKKERLDAAIRSYVDYSWTFGSKNELLLFLRERVRNAHNRVRICSKYHKNVILLSRRLLNHFSIHSKIYGPFCNGQGTTFYEVCIHTKKDVQKLKRLLQ